MNEFDVIERYFAKLAPGGLKDDAAVLKIPPGHELVVTSDTLNAGTHFMDQALPDDIARKALRVNLSDLAAMGADPLSYQLNIAFPKKPSVSWLEQFTAALAEDQKTFNVFCSGGDTTSIFGPLSLSITALGLVPAGRAVTRGGARDGDILALSGPVGDAALGLQVLRGALKTQDDDYFIGRYYHPRPRLDLRVFMRSHAHAAIDISDGLAADLAHIAKASGLGAHVQVSEALFSGPARKLLASGQVTAEALLSGGDDYELLLAVPPGTDLPPGVVSIGGFAAGGGVRFTKADGVDLALSHKGWTHF